MIIEYIKVIFAEMHDIIQKTFIIAKMLRFCGHFRDILRFILLIYWPTMGNDSIKILSYSPCKIVILLKLIVTYLHCKFISMKYRLHWIDTA